MSELGPRAREILHSGRELNRPSDADRERVESRQSAGAMRARASKRSTARTRAPRAAVARGCARQAGL
jgi:hypothetical protein